MSQDKTPAEPKTPAKQLEKLEQAASYEALTEAGKAPLKELVEAYGRALAAIAKLSAVAEAQAVSAQAAQAFASKNGLSSRAKALGRNPLIAQAVALMADLKSPVSLPHAWLQLHAAPRLRAQAIQKIFNNGVILTVPGMSPEEVSEALLAGIDPGTLVSDSPAAKSQRDAAGWYGFRGKNKPVAPKPDTALHT